MKIRYIRLMNEWNNRGIKKEEDKSNFEKFYWNDGEINLFKFTIYKKNYSRSFEVALFGFSIFIDIIKGDGF